MTKILNSGILVVFLLSISGVMLHCTSEQETGGSVEQAVMVPHGYAARLEQVRDNRLIGFGPFRGYYFRPEDPKDLSRLVFVCFNEDGFYSSDMPAGAKLFEGTAVRATLPRADFEIPLKNRINPVFFADAPPEWLDRRPKPHAEYVHFHSCYDGTGPVLTGYWLRHTAIAAFTYDMGGRVEENSPLYHRVQKGVDRDFAKIIEFDRGPQKAQR
ncbi:MAG: hypothetical protein ACOWYE_03295 [Desulfatiglandales bacterium]